MSTSFDTFNLDGEDQPQQHQSGNNHPFGEDDAESYSNFGSYSNFTGATAASDDFSGDQGHVNVDHVQSPEIFGFDGQEPGYSQSPFDPVHVENGNGNGYSDDGVFTTDGPILPPPTDMAPEEGFAFREWRR